MGPMRRLKPGESFLEGSLHNTAATMTFQRGRRRLHPRPPLVPSVSPTSNMTSSSVLEKPVPSSGPAVPSSGPVMPSSGPSVPSSAPAVPSSGPSVPSSAPVVPSSGPVVAPNSETPHGSHFVYATCKCDLVDQGNPTGEVVAKKGERVQLVYPMEYGDDDSSVRMCLKRCHPITGQLSYHCVVVYDDVAGHSMSDFALMP